MKPIQNVTIRRATFADAEKIWEVRTKAIFAGCRGHYPAIDLEAWASSPMPLTFASFIEDESFYVADLQSRIVGFAGLKQSASEVNAVFVLPEFAGHGIGTYLLKRIEEAARTHGIPVLTLNASLNSVPFYKAAGYIERASGIHTTTGGLQIECVHMEKTLGQHTGA